MQGKAGAVRGSVRGGEPREPLGRGGPAGYARAEGKGHGERRKGCERKIEQKGMCTFRQAQKVDDPPRVAGAPARGILPPH